MVNKKNPPPAKQQTIEPNRKRVFSFTSGLIIAMAALVVIFFVISSYRQTTFGQRFLDAYVENQGQVVALSKEEFTPAFSNLMVSISTLLDGGEAEMVFVQMEDAIAKSELISEAAERARGNFPMFEFSVDERRRINNYFDVLAEMDAGRHEYVLALQDCVRLSADGRENAEEYCHETSFAWEQKAQALLEKLNAALELSAEEEQQLQELLGTK